MISQSPVNPAEGAETTVSTNTSDGFVQINITAVPDDSTVATGFVLDAAGAYLAAFTPDIGGVYTVNVDEYRRLPAYVNAADQNVPARDKLIGRTVLSVEVSKPIYLKVHALGRGATLKMLAPVTGQFFTEVEFVDFLDDVSRVAALASAVVTDVTTLEATAIASAGPALATVVAELGTKYALHIPDVAYHASADAVNVVQYNSPLSERAIVASVNDLRDKLVLHMVQGASGGTWHTIDDAANLPVAPKATDMGSAMVLFSDLSVRCYERHRVYLTGGVHHGADSTNTLTAATPLADLIAHYLDALVALAPSTPANELAAYVAARFKYGFSETR